MKQQLKYAATVFIAALSLFPSHAQKLLPVKIIPSATENKIDILIGEKPFTSFLYPSTLEKPVLFPVHAANGAVVTRGFPLTPQPNEPIDHPHHIGSWFNFENVNGLDFWNNSYAIPAEKKHGYGWIKTDSILHIGHGEKGILTYHANWTNQNNDVLLEEKTSFEFSGTAHQRFIDRTTTLKAATDVLFTDVKDGLLGFRLAHFLQMPTDKDQPFKDAKGNISIIKGGSDTVPKGNYISSEGKQGQAVWRSRGRWCMAYSKMGNDSIGVAIIDHPLNPNYPAFWHARGYGLFAANPLGEKIFTENRSYKNLQLPRSTSVDFRFRIIINDGARNLTAEELNRLADEFAQTR
jgi:hypothetical protein